MPRISWALLLLCAGLMGCGDGRPKTIAVTGSVTYQDQPVQGAQVMFSQAGGRPAEGTTDAGGKFQLTSFESGDGAIAGKYKVTVVKMVRQDAADPYSPTKNALPPRYADAATTPLEKEVTSSGPNNFALQLTDE